MGLIPNDEEAKERLALLQKQVEELEKTQPSNDETQTAVALVIQIAKETARKWAALFGIKDKED